VIRVPCNWMWRCLLTACFAHHLYGIRPVQTTIIINLLFGCGQELHPKWIQAVNYFNKQGKSCLRLSQWLCGLRQRFWPHGCWNHRFESCSDSLRNYCMHPWFLVGYILHSVLWVPLGYVCYDSVESLEMRKSDFSMDFLCSDIELYMIFQM
jgi:hypothetical protein